MMTIEGDKFSENLYKGTRTEVDRSTGGMINRSAEGKGTCVGDRDSLKLRKNKEVTKTKNLV
ncbi:MAG: hypothetical protein AB4352_19810 [Hormoscilla sp.]